MPRRRRLFVHMIVTNLTLARPWRVGGTTLLPAGYLLRLVDAALALRDPALPASMVENYRGGLADRTWATIKVPILASDGGIDQATMDAARDTARDVVGALRLFQRSRVRHFNFDHQTFGLTKDIASVVEQRWITDRRGGLGGGWEVHGIMADWAFKTADMQAYRADPRFAYLDRALATTEEHRDDWQRRVIACVRTLNLGTVMVRPATRVVLQATALEALLGNRYRKGARATGAHPLASRAAYLSCGADLEPPDPHGINGRLACRLLAASADPAGDPTLHDRASGTWACSWYGDMRDLSDDRNAAVHGADTLFDHRRAAAHEYHLDRVVLRTLDWIVRTGSARIEDLIEEVRALPADPA